jgi:hypothetical protein
MASVRGVGAAVIALFDQLSARHLLPLLPRELAAVPRANIEFLPIKDAWFSGSMNYLGRARNHDGSPQYEATYEINASLQMSYPEFEQLVSHEVVPGHVTTFAYLQDLYVRGKAGFEATVLTMNTRAATLFEGIANNAILIAHGVSEIDDLPDDDIVCVAGPDHPLAGRRRVNLHDVATALVAVSLWGSESPGLVARLEAAGLPPTSLRLITDSGIAGLLARDHGHVAFVTASTAAHDLEQGALARLRVAGLPRWRVPLALVVRNRGVDEPAVARLLAQAKFRAPRDAH